VSDEIAPAWMPDKAGSIFSEALTAHPEINATVEANDGLANAVIQVLKARASRPGPSRHRPGCDAPGPREHSPGLAVRHGLQADLPRGRAAVVVATYLRAGHEPPLR